MKDPRKILLLITIVFLAGMFTVTLMRDWPRLTKQKQTQNNYKNWTLFRNGYAFPLPHDWKNSSDVGGTAVLEPRDLSTNELKNIKKISVTVLSDKKATGQRFTTEREFTEWAAVVGEVQGKIQKLDNITVDGEKAIMLIDNSIENKWKIIVWIRKEQINFYINFDGEGKNDKVDIDVISYITSHFNFVAPAMTGKEGKN